MIMPLRLPALAAVLALALAACGAEPTTPPDDVEGAAPPAATPAPFTLMLDYVPNTNHSGIYLAQARGYFRDAGLDLRIIQPGEVYAEQAVASGAADVGVSFQEALTLARSEGSPLVSLAAILQHNSSAFASRKELGIASPADYGGKRYGGFGSPFEGPTLRALMRCAAEARGDGEPPAPVEQVEVGLSDPLALLATDKIDLAWIFYGWQGIQAEQQGLELDLVPLADHLDCIPDYYTPLLFSRQATIDERPQLVRAFVGAAARGYAEAIAEPDAAAAALLAAVPELDAALVRQSQAWLSPRYQDDAPRWGEQKAEVWQAYADWLHREGVLKAPLDTAAAFSNAFLP